MDLKVLLMVLPVTQLNFLDVAHWQVNPDYITWIHVNHLVMSWLYSSFTESIITQIFVYDTTSGIRHALESTYAAVFTSHLIEIKGQLWSLKKGGLFANDYVFKLKSLTDKFAAIGAPMSYKDQLIYFLRVY